MILDSAIRDKNVLLIGSGNDLDDRAMQDIINGNTYDIIARVNKPYGNVKDVGIRTDIIFVRLLRWYDVYWRKFFRINKDIYSSVVAFYEGVAAQRHYDDLIAKQYNLRKASTGLCAVKWLSERQPNNISVIGFGFKNGEYSSKKTYSETNIIDKNPLFDWEKEHEIIKNLVTFI